MQNPLDCKPKEDITTNATWSTIPHDAILCECELALVNVTLKSSEIMLREQHRKVLIHVAFKKTGPLNTHIHT